MSSEGHGHIQTTGDTEDLLVTAGVKRDGGAAGIGRLNRGRGNGASGDAGLDWIGEGVLGPGPGAGNGVAAEIALGRSTGVRAGGRDADGGEIKVLARGREVDHGSRRCLIAEGATGQLSGCGGAEIVDRHRETKGGGNAG